MTCIRLGWRYSRELYDDLATATMQGGAPIMEKSKDEDRTKGAMEQDSQNQGGNVSMQGQLGHRDQDFDVKDADSDQPW